MSSQRRDITTALNGAIEWLSRQRTRRLVLADRVMYGVKQHGKNTVWAESAESSPAAV